ncbi:MAG: hypothetical protein PWP24_32 [Clostridiales bacterium]|nr:hypothetical protein [Clostridiales bacterium]
MPQNQKNFKTYILSFVLVIMVLFLNGCHTKKNTSEADFDDFLNQIFIQEVQTDSITLNYTLADPVSYGVRTKAPTLGSFSSRQQKKQLATLENYKTALTSFSYSSLTSSQKKDYDVLLAYLNMSLTDEKYLYYNEILSPTTGIQAQLPVLLSEYHIESKEDLDQYLSLLSCTKDYFSSILSFEAEKAKRGLFMSDENAKAVIAQCERFSSTKENNAMIETFNTRIEEFDWLTKKQKNKYKSRNQKKVLNVVIPAYEDLMAGLYNLLGSGTNDEGLAHFPRGKDYYTYLIHTYTGSSKSIPEFKEGLEKLVYEDIQTIKKILLKNPAILEQLNDNLLPTGNPEALLDNLSSQITADFPELKQVSYQIKYVHPSLEAYLSPAFYLSPPIDKDIQNTVYINTYGLKENASLYATLAHEGYPGHLYQTVFYHAQNPAPIRTLLNFSGYSEGWATYAELYSYRYCGQRPTIWTILQANHSLTLCLYAIVDLGINYYGWSFSETKDYLNTFSIKNDALVHRMYTSMTQEPGNYLKYAGGYYEILELKKYAQKHMGKSYSDKAFHSYIVSFGPAPFDIIKKYMKKELLN